MVERKNIGSTSIGVGGLLLALGILYIVLTSLGFTPDQAWIVPWITNYVIAGVGILIGLLLLGYGIHIRRLLSEYAQKVERLAEEKAEQAQVLRRKTAELRESVAELERKETALQLTKGRLKTSREVAKRRAKQMYRVRGKLGDRSKRLKRIEEIAKVKKKKK